MALDADSYAMAVAALVAPLWPDMPDVVRRFCDGDRSSAAQVVHQCYPFGDGDLGAARFDIYCAALVIARIRDMFPHDPDVALRRQAKGTFEVYPPVRRWVELRRSVAWH